MRRRNDGSNGNDSGGKLQNNHLRSGQHRFYQIGNCPYENPADGIENDVTLVELESDDYAKELKRLDKKNLVIIPKGFTEQVDKGEQAETIYVSQMTSLSTMSNVSTGSDTALSIIESAVKSALYTDKVSKGQLAEDEVLQLETRLQFPKLLLSAASRLKFHQ